MASKSLLVISGTPGVGKSTLAIGLAKELDYQRLDLHDYYKQVSSGYNRSKRCYDIDLKKLEELIKTKKKEAQKGLIFDSHIAHLLPKRIVKTCIVLTCTNLKTLKTRLEKRGYHKAKVAENIEAEIMQVCLAQAQEKRHNIIQIDVAKKTQKQVRQEALNSLQHK